LVLLLLLLIQVAFNSINNLHHQVLSQLLLVIMVFSGESRIVWRVTFPATSKSVCMYFSPHCAAVLK
jgi:hypothetical protein